MVLVAISVHERGALVRHCFATAAEMELPAGSEIVVFDDASQTFDVPALIAETGLACTYVRMDQTVGVTRMVRLIWERLLESKHSHLLFLDSDMVPNRDAVSVGVRLSQRFSGLISLYNSIAHPGDAMDDELLRKDTVGNAATFWSRELVTLAVETVSTRPWGIDFAYCDAFRVRGVPIAATVQSRVQHIGIFGLHNHEFGALEHGLGFVPDSLTQWGAIGYVYNELMTRQRDFLLPASKRDLVSRLRRLLRR